MSSQRYQIGDRVIFTDEHGRELIGVVVNASVPGMPEYVAIDASISIGEAAYGAYTRLRTEVRPAPPTLPRNA